MGSLIILGYQFNLESQYTIGNLYAVLCSVCLAIAFMIGEKVRKDENTIVYTRKKNNNGPKSAINLTKDLFTANNYHKKFLI